MISSRFPAIASERMPSLPRPVSIPIPPSKVSVAILPYPLPRTRNEPGAAAWAGTNAQAEGGLFSHSAAARRLIGSCRTTRRAPESPRDSEESNDVHEPRPGPDQRTQHPLAARRARRAAPAGTRSRAAGSSDSGALRGAPDVRAPGRNTPADRRRSPRSLESGNYRTRRERRDGAHRDGGDRRLGAGGLAGRAEGRRLHARGRGLRRGARGLEPERAPAPGAR